MCLHTHAHRNRHIHIHVHQRSWTFMRSIIHINSGAPKRSHTQTCIVYTKSMQPDAHRPGRTLMWALVSPNHQRQKGTAFSAVVHYLACLSVCLPTTWQNHLLGENRHKFMYLSCLFPYNRLFIYTFSMFLAPCCVKLVCTTNKCHTITSFPLRCNVKSCFCVLFCFSEWNRTVIACPSPTP